MENKPGRKRNWTFYVIPVLQWIGQKKYTHLQNVVLNF